MSEEETAAFDKAQRKYRNKAADKRQYEKYREIYGKEILKSFDKFQEMKYNNAKEWERFKAGKQERLNQMNFENMSGLVGRLGNKETRLWYKSHDENIVNLIDKSQSLENQARQACDLRNKFKNEARDLMKDQMARAYLDINRKPRTFEQLLEDKKNIHNITGENAYRDIIRSSGTTNAEYDKKAGL